MEEINKEFFEKFTNELKEREEINLQSWKL